MEMSGRKRLAYGTRKMGVLPAETSGQVKRKRKSQLCDDHHRFENGARFEGLLPFAAVTSEWPTTRELAPERKGHGGQFCGQLGYSAPTKMSSQL
jgi:hypothetical protein